MLYVVSSPIGNLDDLSLRQAKTLMDSDVILAEDTRSAQIILDAINSRFPPPYATPDALRPKLISYYKDREFDKLPMVLELLKEGKAVSLLSENGTPLISDPGYLLVKTCVKDNIPFTFIPGPSAVTSALVLSGQDPSQFLFLGFFPKKQSHKLQLIKKMKSVKTIFPEMCFVLYESAVRLRETFKCFGISGWDPQIAVCREMTKKFEEIVRGKADQLDMKEFKGEVTLVIS